MISCPLLARKLDGLTKTQSKAPKWQTVFSARDDVSANVIGKFKYIEESRAQDQSIKQSGLRSPQIGAVHAALGHWSYSSEPSTIVLPTGTGKTDCMIALAALRGMIVA
jgi:superfamily II DNA or RNA helicase